MRTTAGRFARSEEASAYAKHLRNARERSGLSLSEAADRLDYLPSNLSTLESGRKLGSEQFVRKADDLYGCGGELLYNFHLARISYGHNVNKTFKADENGDAAYHARMFLYDFEDGESDIVIEVIIKEANEP